MNTVKLKVLTRSSNHNAFGLRNHILVTESGLAFRALRSAYVPDAEKYAPNSEHLLRLGAGDVLDVKTKLVRDGFECIQELPKAPAAVIKELFAI